MNRTRLSTTVDTELLQNARGLRAGSNDAALIDEALAALLAAHRDAEVDASYAAYDAHPLDEPDEWGDLASFREAAASSRARCRCGVSCGGARWPRSAAGRCWCSPVTRRSPGSAAPSSHRAPRRSEGSPARSDSHREQTRSRSAPP